MLKVVMARGMRLKKGGGDLEVHKQNVVSSKQTIAEENVSSSEQIITKQNVASSKQTISEQSVVPLELRPKEEQMLLHQKQELQIDVSSNLCGLELTTMTVCNSNGEIILNID